MTRVPQTVAGVSNLWVFVAIFAGSLLLRLPFRAQFLVNWDAVNFALATKVFDIQSHQPHPPGYIGYVALGRLLNYLTGDPNASLTLLSAVAGALAPALLFLLASQFMARRYAVASAVLFALSPVAWYYSEVALTYSVEAALALAILWTGYQAKASQSRRHLFAATVLLAVLGSARQSGAIFLLPLWLYVVWAFPWRVRRRALGVFVLCNLAWLVPLLWLSGGPLAYLRESASLAGTVVAPISVFTLNFWGLLRNVAFVAAGFLIGVNIGLAAIALAVARGAHPAAELFRHDRAFFLLWIVPTLLAYLLVHTGQLGYVLLVLPAGFLLVGTSLASFADHPRSWQPLFADRVNRLRHWAMPAFLILLLAVMNVSTFFLLPKVLYAFADTNDMQVVQRLTVSASRENEAVATARARQYDLRRNDTHWQDLLDVIRTFDPETTVVLAVPDGAGSYRQLAYYLADEYRVYGLGRDKNGDFGHLFTATEGADSYTIEGLRKARKALFLPPEVEWVIIPDAGAYQHLDRDTRRIQVVLESRTPIVISPVPPQTMLRFDGDANSAPYVSVGTYPAVY